MSVSDRIPESIEGSPPRPPEELLPLVYKELRKLANVMLGRLPAGQTLQPTALVHEAYMKMAKGKKSEWQSRRHFFASAAETMRHIMVDRARRHLRKKRDGADKKLDVDELEIASPLPDEVMVELDDALKSLQETSPDRAEIVKLRFFVGLSEPEIAEVLGISERSVSRKWQFAKAWLYAQIEKLREVS